MKAAVVRYDVIVILTVIGSAGIAPAAELRAGSGRTAVESCNRCRAGLRNGDWAGHPPSPNYMWHLATAVQEGVSPPRVVASCCMHTGVGQSGAA